jgi:hypothetical protein
MYASIIKSRIEGTQTIADYGVIFSKIGTAEATSALLHSLRSSCM